MHDWITEAGKETPSEAFVDQVMQGILALQRSSFTVRPLISRKSWLWFFGILSGIVGVWYFIPEGEGRSVVSEKWAALKEILPSLSTDLEAWSSASYVYGTLVLLVALVIQFGLIKRTNDKYYKEW